VEEVTMIKRALVLSGGGSKGQYHVGAVRALMGELLCAFLSQYPIGADATAVKELEALFTPLETDDIYKRHFPFGKLHALWQPSLFDSRPLRKLIRDNLNGTKVRESGRELRIGATSLTTGEYRVFTQDDIPLWKYVYASASYPLAFPPEKISKEWWTDGGVRTVTPIMAAIKAGATEIDVVMAGPEKSTPVFDPDPNTIDVALRSVELMSDEIINDDLKKALLYNRLIEAGEELDKKSVEFAVVRPSRALNEDSLHFDPREASELQLIGYRDALDVMVG
jgi:NTE family protein